MIQCTTCGNDNPGDSAFCARCGTALELVCANGHLNPPDSAFCSRCGLPLDTQQVSEPPIAYTPPHLAEKILRERQATEGERRTVTILFADAVGSTTIGENVDEELLYRLMQGAFERMMTAVHKYEGTITQFRGDGIMALFGAPIAHEDAARRAVSAALEMQTALVDYSEQTRLEHGVEFQFRVGLNTGPVVVGSIGDNLEMDYTAIGDTANLAARMEQGADPGTVFISDNTYHAVKDYFKIESLGPRQIKGKSEPVIVHKALGEGSVRTRLEAAAIRGLTPFVGRSHELSVLSGYHQQASRGNGQIVLVSGDAGIGKSRVVREFRASVDEGHHALDGQCISFGRNIPYLPIIDLVKSAFDVKETDDPQTTIDKVDSGAASWNSGSQKTVPYLKYLLNVDPGDLAVVQMDALERRAGIFDALRSLVLERTTSEPLLIAIEDLHWIDDSSAEALSALVDVVGSISCLLLLTARPGYLPGFADRTFFSRIALGSLQPEDSASMARNVLDAGALPQELTNLISDKAEGNPFFVEEVAKSLVEGGILTKDGSTYGLTRDVSQISIPNTIQEVILSRIDRLDRDAKGAIQLASVIGREFTARLLQRVSEANTQLNEPLTELKKLELIYEKTYFPELSYMFKHALTHDVAYETLLIERRKMLHTLIGTAIEELYSDRLAEHYETLAHHFLLGQQWKKAFDYQALAGEKAQAAYANQDALLFFNQALQIVDHLEAVPVESIQRILDAKFDTLITIGMVPEAAGVAQQLIDAARGHDDQHIEGVGWGQLAFAEFLSHRFDQAQEAATTALTIADRLSDGAVRAGGVFALGFLSAMRGNLDVARTQFAEVRELSRQHNLPVYETWSSIIPGIIEEWRGNFEAAQPLLDEAVELGDLHHQTTNLLQAKWFAGLNLAATGKYSHALDRLNETLALCLRMQDIFVQARCLNTIGWVYMELYDAGTGLEFNQRGLDLSLLMGDDEIISNARVNIADCYELLGRHDDARRELEEIYAGLGALHEWMKWRYSQHIIHSLGEVVLLDGDHARALALAEECLELALQSDSKKNVVKGRRLKGQALAAAGRHAEAEVELQAAVILARQVANPPQLWKSSVALGDTLIAEGKGQEASAAYRQALDVVERVAAGLTDETMRKAFLGAAQVEAMRAGANRGLTAASPGDRLRIFRV